MLTTKIFLKGPCDIWRMATAWGAHGSSSQNSRDLVENLSDGAGESPQRDGLRSVRGLQPLERRGGRDSGRARDAGNPFVKILRS
jgi:hypothetical protein